MLALLRDSVAWIVIAYIAIRSFSPRTAWPLVVLAMCGTLLAKIVIVNNTLTPADVAAMPLALTGALVLGKQGSRQPITLIWLLAGYLVVSGLSPFNFHTAQVFHWIPFTGSLSGSMLLNLKALAAKAFFIGALIYLALDYGFTLKRTATVLAASLLALEIAQVWVGTHTPEITDAILVLFIASAFLALPGAGTPHIPSNAAGDAADHTADRQRDRIKTSSNPEPGLLDRAWLYPRSGRLVLLVLATIALTALIYAVLGLPKIPYNVRELFGGQSSWWRIGFFSLAIFSFGIDGAIAGHRVARSRVP